MEASVIIVTKNQKHILQKSLPILLNQKFRGKYEIIVVDNASTDGAGTYISSLPVQLVKIQPMAFNFANAFNSGAKKAKGRYLVRLSGDVIPITKNFLEEILRPFADGNVGATYGRYTITGRKNYNFPPFWPADRFPNKAIRYSMYPNPLKMLLNAKFKGEVFSLAGGCCAIRREVWKKRPFNENLVAAEDAEYAWFLHLVGYDIVYNPKAKVIHEHKNSGLGKTSLLTDELFSKWRWQLGWEITKYYLEKLFLKDVV